jgi:ribosomal protein S18 acetylase RimI-like enzyme
MKLVFKAFDEIAASDEQVAQVKNLVFHSLDLYGDLPMSVESCSELIFDEISTSGTECYNPLMALAEDRVVGIICSFPLTELKARQMASMLSIMRRLDRTARKDLHQKMLLGEYTVAPILADDGIYISRVAIDHNLRNTGYGSKLLRHFLNKHANHRVSLHVDRKNVPAIRYYQKHGFEFERRAEHRKLVMTHLVV